jgi:phosphoglycerate dehydrogenase-like enzyme
MGDFRVGVTRDLRAGEHVSSYPMEALEEAGLGWRFLAQDTDPVRAVDIERLDAVIVGGVSLAASTFEAAEPPLIVARLGAGFDTVDVERCTARGIAVTTAPDGARRPMAAGGMAFLLALAHRLPEKERRARAGRWDRDVVGTGLSGRTLGILGLGSIGRDVAALAAPFRMRLIGHDKYASAPAGVELLELDSVLREADFVIVTLPLGEDTYHLMDDERFALMKPGSYFINIARGPIVEQVALARALEDGRLAGAAIDVFEREPVDPADPLLALDNVIVAPHAIGLTQEMIDVTSRSACESVLAYARGRPPATIINPEVLEHPRQKERLAR